MNFNDHSLLAGKHAFLSASSHAWVNYTDDKLDDRFLTAMMAAHGTRLHEFAKEAIQLRIRLPRNSKTLNRYVNDAISYDMTPEQILFHSENAFGTADAIRFDQDTNRLLIHDLKTGVTKVSMVQLEVYTAFFCLEYRHKPHKLDTTLRIYQNDDVWEHVPDPEDILYIMDRIVTFDNRIKELKKEVR